MKTQPTTHERLIAARREIFNLNTGSNQDLFINNYDNKQSQKISHKIGIFEIPIGCHMIELLPSNKL